MNSKLKVGIIGTGFGKMIAMNFKAIDSSVELYFAGRSKEKLDKLQEELGVKEIFLDWKDLLNKVQLDLLVIASISSQHKEMFEYASQLGIPILVEKPAALKTSDVTSMIQSIKNSNLPYVVNHEGRFHPVVAYIRELVQSGKLGDILTIRSGAYTNWYSNDGYQETWNQKIEYGGGQIYSIGTHQLDLALFILGFPSVINGCVQKLTYNDARFKEIPSSDSQFSAHFETEKMTSIQIFNDCYCFGYKDFTLEILGSKGVVIYSDQKGLKMSYSNTQPLEDVSITDPIPEVTLGSSILTKSMKYMTKALIEAVTEKKNDERFSTLENERIVLEAFEKFSSR